MDEEIDEDEDEVGAKSTEMKMNEYNNYFITMSYMAFYFETLIVWKKAFVVVEKTYLILKKFPKEETYALSDQMRRSSVSIPSNIAEGIGRRTIADKNQFFYIAQGSAMELQTQILLAKKFAYITNIEQEEISALLEEIVKMLFSMSRNDKRSSV